MYIIAGEFKGYKLISLPTRRIRPTMNKVRESIFTMIRDRLEDAEVLDLFAGTGSLGIEALSGGARLCHFVDHASLSIRCISNNVKKLNISDRVKIIKSPVMSFIARCKDKYDVIFADPPYGQPQIEKMIDTLIMRGILKPHGLLILEADARENILLPKGYTLKQKLYGDTQIAVISQERDVEDL
ncbi:MAG: 16S rRNA (guanine(966)-N(2))-methyltransferase RsmD [Candidatus Cloacimonadia bacterium]